MKDLIDAVKVNLVGIVKKHQFRFITGNNFGRKDCLDTSKTDDISNAFLFLEEIFVEPLERLLEFNSLRVKFDEWLDGHDGIRTVYCKK